MQEGVFHGSSPAYSPEEVVMRYIIQRRGLRGLGEETTTTEETTTSTDLILSKDTKFGWITLIVASLATGVVGYLIGKR